MKMFSSVEKKPHPAANYCKLSIILDSSTPTFEPNTLIKGKVILKVNVAGNYETLFISNQIFTHGKGDSNFQDVNFVKYHLGTLSEGIYEYPFEFKAAREPKSYYGQCITLDWRIYAVLANEETHHLRNDSSDFDSGYINILPGLMGMIEAMYDATKMYKIEQTSTPEYNIIDIEPKLFNSDDRSIQSSSSNSFEFPDINIFEVAIILIILNGAIFGSSTSIFVSIDTPIGIIMGVVSAIIIIAALYYKYIFLGQRGSRIEYLETKIVAITTDSIQLKLNIVPSSELIINRIDAKLVLEEHAIDTSGSWSTDYKEEVVASTDSLDIENVVNANEPFESQLLTLRLPDKWVDSFSFKYNQLAWYIFYSIETPLYTHNYKSRVITQQKNNSVSSTQQSESLLSTTAFDSDDKSGSNFENMNQKYENQSHNLNPLNPDKENINLTKFNEQKLSNLKFFMVSLALFILLIMYFMYVKFLQ